MLIQLLSSSWFSSECMTDYQLVKSQNKICLCILLITKKTVILWRNRQIYGQVFQTAVDIFWYCDCFKTWCKLDEINNVCLRRLHGKNTKIYVFPLYNYFSAIFYIQSSFDTQLICGNYRLCRIFRMKNKNSTEPLLLQEHACFLFCVQYSERV